MFTPGMIVRRRKRRRTMVVINVEGEAITCGWIAHGRFYKRRFSADTLEVRSSYSELWPLM
ncbi:hypothetical protein [Musicola paradisiaca]|uniref:Uncharacterized protein n=1 Tax=Musicola paradisiaca (strain Ech703) TaxID=579405 RepID=C6C9W2_MUSP7|nr:hypothetical protein [Musicola paradisiaca]ACS86384.1 hypothetical protein Dd703_2607 [Musicola paradisiaca Ech703]